MFIKQVQYRILSWVQLVRPAVLFYFRWVKLYVTMRKLLLICCLLQVQVVLAQSTTYNYKDLLYYQHALYLRTPSVYLNAAGARAQAGDTAAAIGFIREAIALHLYDTNAVCTDNKLKFITQTRYWARLRKSILANRAGLGDPNQMQVVTSDIASFWKVFDQAHKPGADKLIMDEYIMKGSQGLRTLFEVRMKTQVNRIVETIRTHKMYFESIRPVTLQLHRLAPHMIEAARKLKALYPAAIFPPTTFSIGVFGALGTPDGYSGQLIGAEFLCDSQTVNKTGLSERERMGLTDTSTLFSVLIHELIHVEQQTAASNTLLAQSVNEGAADLITWLLLGYHLNNQQHAYGNAHEAALWTRFKQQMNGEDVSEWLYNSRTAPPGIPGDLGYYMGYKICEAYYNKASDKKQAVKDMLTIADFGRFLEQSGYGPEGRQ